ncbi:MAG: hypothetical protein RLZZ104_1770, partial [Pseudomonadota bacterium]
MDRAQELFAQIASPDLLECAELEFLNIAARCDVVVAPLVN